MFYFEVFIFMDVLLNVFLCSEDNSGDPLGLELQRVVIHHVGAGIEPRYPGRAATILNC